MTFSHGKSIEICGFKLQPWTRQNDNAITFERRCHQDFPIITAFPNGSQWMMWAWEETKEINEQIFQWKHISTGDNPEIQALDSADELLLRLEKLRSFQ